MYKQRNESKTENLHTDEQLVASALYLTAAENKSAAVITRDSDIRRILFNTLSYLTYQHTFAYAGIVESVRDSRTRIYHPFETNGFQQRYDTLNFDQNSCLIIPKEKLTSIRQKLNFCASTLIA